MPAAGAIGCGKRRHSPAIHQFPETILGGIENRISIADQENIELEAEESPYAIAQERGIVYDLVRQEFASSRGVANDGVSNE
jgi:hypothetical protein